MTDITTISGIDCFEKNGTAYLNLEAVARGLGFTQEKNGTEYVRWETVGNYMEEIGFPNKLGKGDFIPENIFYRLAMKAKNEAAEKFQAKITHEVIPTIRKTGGYVNDEDAFVNTYLPNVDGAVKALFSQTLHALRRLRWQHPASRSVQENKKLVVFKKC